MTPTTTTTTTEAYAMELTEDMITTILSEWARDSLDFADPEIALSENCGCLGEAAISILTIRETDADLVGPEGFPSLERQTLHETRKTVSLSEAQTAGIIAAWVARTYSVGRPRVEFDRAGWGGLRAVVTRTVVS